MVIIGAIIWLESENKGRKFVGTKFLAVDHWLVVIYLMVFIALMAGGSSKRTLLVHTSLLNCSFIVGCSCLRCCFDHHDVS